MPKDNGITFNTDREVKALKLKDKRYMAKDERNNGLSIEVHPTGRKVWLYRYTLNGKQEGYRIGRYPDIGLQEARDKRTEAANKVANGISPQQEKTDLKKGNSKALLFRDYGERYTEEVIKKERKDPYSMILCLNNDIYPMLGDKPVKDITTDDIRRVIWRKKEQGYDAAANQVRGLLKRMFDYAVTWEFVQFNPVLAIPSRHVHKQISRDRYLSTNEIRKFYTTLLNSRVYRPRKLGLLLSLLTLVRKSELLNAKWEDIDFDAKQWLFPTPKADSKTGQSRELVVYMSEQIITILKELKTIAGDEPHVFVGRKKGTRCSHNAFNTAQKTALALTDIPDFTIHDLRRTASTHLNEKGFNADAIEKCLNHTMKGVRGIYNKHEYAPERITMMQAWSDFVFSVIYEPNLVFFNEAARLKSG